MIWRNRGEDADANVASLTECLGTSHACGASGDNIIDEEQMLTTDGFGIDEFKDMFYIVMTLPAPFVGLTAFENCATYDLLENRQSCDLTDTLGNLLTLVVASLMLAFFCKRNRHNSIDSIEESRRLNLLGKHTSDGGADIWSVFIFQFIDDVGSLGVGLVIEEGRGTFNRNLCPKQTGHLILISVVMESSAWQMEIAFGTDNFFSDRQSMSADDTEPWGNQIE